MRDAERPGPQSLRGSGATEGSRPPVIPSRPPVIPSRAPVTASRAPVIPSDSEGSRSQPEIPRSARDDTRSARDDNAFRIPHPASRVPPPVIHAITSDRILARPEFLAQAHVVMDVLGELGAVHVRAHHLPTAWVYELADALREEQTRTGCWLVVNDRVDVALTSGARAVQLTSRSMTAADARAIAPALRIGASVHSIADARAAAAARADWLVAGHIFETASHPGAPGRGLRFLRELATATPLPCIAIGGVRPEHVAELVAAGAYGVAAISGIWDADDAERAASEYLSAYDALRGS
ncbi:MAG TPA: thiamine phosphate synthase [Gemmatimonadaceae bacterium]